VLGRNANCGGRKKPIAKCKCFPHRRALCRKFKIVKSVAIIGAGITGLTAAFYLKRRGIPATVFEAGNRAGGVIRSLRQNGFLAECGPNTILETSPKIPQLISDLNLESLRLYTNPSAKNRYIVRDKMPMAMPTSPIGFLTTKIFSARAKLAVLREPFVPVRNDDADESVADFVTRRLNREFLDRAVDALVSGIYAGNPEKLSIRHALPRLFEQEKNYGSLIRGQIFGAKDRKRRGEIARSKAKMFSFDSGLQVLTDALAAQLGDSLKLNSPVTKIAKTENGWHISTVNGEAEFGAVIYCGTAHKLAELKMESPATIDLAQFSEIRYAPVASIVLGFRRKDVAHPLDGFGMLIPKIENFKILGTIFSSSLFPNRAPQNFVTLTTYIGGERQPELTLKSPDELIAIARVELQRVLGVNREPVFQHVTLYPKAIPQYNVGYGKFKQAMDEIESKAAGFFFAGHYRDGVSLGDSIVSGINIAERVAKSSIANHNHKSQ
jgi:oxygen-dependent protoporphyrinogen oxidase